MPSTRPCAAFEPISPEFDLKALVESTPNFEYAVRIHSDMIEHHGLAAFERLVLMHVILGGKPLVIEGYEIRLDRWIFAIQWLRDNCGSNVVDARDLTKQTNVPMSIGHYLKHMSLLTNQWNVTNYKDPERQRMYLKDIDCPTMWQERLAEHIPPVLYYLNESTGDYGGLGAVDEPEPSGSGTRRGRGIAKAGDLMSSLPKEMRAENLMCYIGHEGTYTPCHREMCASLGHNIMIEASSGGTEDGNVTKPGSSIWFMTETKEREVVSEYWLSRLGHDIEVEKHFAQVNAWKNAPFKTYVIDQKPGDFILIPPLAPHQVWNRGTRTMKIAWNRTTVETLEMAMSEALFKARMVCRDEQYKNKAIVYYTLQKYDKLIHQADKHKQKNPNSKRLQKADGQIRQLQKDFKRLHVLYTKILVSESFYPDRVEKKVEMVPFDGNITCSYCRCNIFNRFLTCPSCVGDLPNGDQDTYDVCLECYAMGRSCACISKLKWVEQFSWGELVQKHDQWRHLIIQHEGALTEKSPKSLKHELERLGKQRTLAQICQTELLKRPWRDIRKPLAPNKPDADDEIQVDENGYEKKKVKKKSEKFQRDHGRCHVDSYWEPRWKQAQCTRCQKNYCYGILFRAYDMMPQDIMANPEWKCPSCLKICNCRNCSKRAGYKKYTPKGTLLGHNTKAVADPRSVESLVDFSYSNMQWIKKADDDYEAHDTRRLQRRRREANAAMNQEDQLDDNYVDDEQDNVSQTVEGGILRLAEQEGIPIDPNLNSGWTAINGNANADSNDEDEVQENPEQVAPRLQVDDDDQSQFMLPAGGIVQDPQHAYDDTEAVTFTYPEPIMGTQLPPAPVEGYQEAELPYQEADVPSPSRIEMVERRRKRKLDESEKAFHLTTPSNKKKAPPKKRQSLVVRLAVSRDKLKEIGDPETVARSALNGVAGPAPVVSSDLQALNIYPTEDGQPVQKRQRREEKPISVEVDDEYAPSRSRDRRKLPGDGTPLPPPLQDDITRRTTRLHRITYAEPDEEEFNEVIPSKSKLATMEGANVLNSVEIHDNGSEQPDQDDEDDEEDEEPEPSPPAKVTGKRPALTTPAIHNPPADEVSPRPLVQHVRAPAIAAASPDSSRPNTASSNASRSTYPKNLEVQAQANRRAKMAIDLGDIDDLDEWTPEPDIDDDIVLPDVPLSQSKPAAMPKTQSMPKTVNPQHIQSKKSTSSTSMSNGRNKTFIPIGRGGPKSAKIGSNSAQRAQANELWADSDSDNY